MTLRGEYYWDLFFLIVQNHHHLEQLKKLYWNRVSEDLHDFFKFNLCCHNIFKIKNILTINIHLSFFKKTTLSEYVIFFF